MAASTSCLGLPWGPGETDLCGGQAGQGPSNQPRPELPHPGKSYFHPRRIPDIIVILQVGKLRPGEGDVVLARQDLCPPLLDPQSCPQLPPTMESLLTRRVTPEGPLAEQVDRAFRARSPSL